MQYVFKKLPALALALLLSLIASSEAFAQANIVVLNGDAAGVGFNDATPATPVGGNNGTTVGEQRLIAFQTAANIWGATLTSGPTIVIHGSWAELACTATSGTIGSAGNNSNVWRDFTGSVFGFWYGNALANALSGTDRNGASHELSAQFNVKLGTPGCLENGFWYYGLDNNHGPNGVDLVSVLLHEFAHGLGFQTFTNKSTGEQIGDDVNGRFPSIYDRYLFDNTAGKSWPQMTNAERVASAINTGNLVWVGPQVLADTPNVLSGTPRLRINSPAAIAGNYQVGTASFGPALSPAGTTGDVVHTTPNDGCTAISNSIAGKIALIDRGNCTFVQKTQNAQNAGATAVIIVDNVSNPTPPGMSGTDPTITISTVSITQANGNTIKAQLPTGVNATLFSDTSMIAGTDSARRPLMYAPNPLEGGSSVSHWDNSLLPNQLMEPNIGGDLSHAVSPPLDLTLSLFKDIGWPTGTLPPPPPPPANDNFASAQAISGCSGTVTGTNVAATKEAGEPAHSPTSPGSTKSVWYQWQAVSTSNVTINTVGSNYDTLLAVYTGNSVSGLTLVANNDDIATGDTASTVTFTATQGTIYRIAVDGFDNGGSGGDTGSIVLNWNQTCTAVGPTIFVEQGTNVLAAVDSVTQVKGPFTVLTPNNFSQGGGRRIIFFTTDLGLPAGNTTGLIVRANTTSLPVETAGPFSLISGSYVIVRLDNLTPGTYNLTVTLNGANSTNAPTIQIIP
ncbi:MAG: PA domain-containing protein [Pyrinomonadaceae bacterium]